MLTRIRDADNGGFDVKVFSADGDIETRNTADLAEAFAMQKAVQDTGKWPDGKEPGK